MQRRIQRDLAATQKSKPSASTSVPELMDIDTLALKFNSSARHVRRLVAERRIPYLKVGHFVRFDPQAINSWLQDQRVESRRP